MRKLLIGMLATCCSFGATVSSAHAICGQTLATRAERDSFNLHSCDQEFINTTKKEANLRQSHWVNRGWDDANSCNMLLEFPKFWNSWYLVTYGTQQVPDPLPCPPGQIICLDVRDRPWLGVTDYLSLVRASGGSGGGATFPPVWHHPLFYKPNDSNPDMAGYYEKTCPRPTGFFLFSDLVEGGCEEFVDTYRNIDIGCKSFDKEPDGNPPAMGATPGAQASFYVHESWHAWDHDGCCIKECPAGTTSRCPSGATCSADYTCVGANHSCDQATGCCYYNVVN
jgi:hypothetical protein